MRVEVTAILQYDIPEDDRTMEAYGASSMGEVLVKEHQLLEEDGDYLVAQIGNEGTRVLILQAVRVPDVRPEVAS